MKEEVLVKEPGTAVDEGFNQVGSGRDEVSSGVEKVMFG